uniref:Uncharacterized protein n=2 Tax=Arion vulgaris TaxID=1028688 RepID=A0A0B6Z9V7_9EUPU
MTASPMSLVGTTYRNGLLEWAHKPVQRYWEQTECCHCVKEDCSDERIICDNEGGMNDSWKERESVQKFT